MPYRCVHCSKVYDDGSQEILNGCSNGDCHSKFFFYMRKEQLQKIAEKEEYEPDLTAVEKKQIERDVRDILGEESEETPVFLDFESIKIVKPGKYLLDLSKLFDRERPKVYKLEDGKYIVDLTALKIEDFERGKN